MSGLPPPVHGAFSPALRIRAKGGTDCEPRPVRTTNSASSTVPKIVPSVYLYALSSKLGRSAETRIFTSESERIQTALKC
jgi:hypothetical protein